MPGKKKKESKEHQTESQAEQVQQSGPGVLSQKVKAMTELPLEETERKMIAGALELGQKTVKEIMVPRPEMVCAEENSTVEQIRQLVLEKGHSRIPLFQGEIDTITGILLLRDLFVAMGKSEPVDLKKIARKAYFVPDGKRVDDLLTEMRKEKTHIAIVAEEYGGIAGLGESVGD